LFQKADLIGNFYVIVVIAYRRGFVIIIELLQIIAILLNP